MEIAVDSNSESDISDSWAVIDDYSSLEWNEITPGLGPAQCDFMKSGILRSNSSKSELSDEDSIEVLTEDHTDNLSDKEAEVFPDEEWNASDETEKNENISTGTCKPTPDLSYCATHLKKINHKWRETNPLLTVILIVGILGGLCLGYLWASHKSEDSSIQPTKAFLTKLEDEIKFLRRQLRAAHSSLQSAVSKTIPKLHHVTKQVPHPNTKENFSKAVFPRMCSITDFMVKSPVLQNNFSDEYCLASDKPRANENVWTNSDDKVSVNMEQISSSSEVSAMKYHLVKTAVNNNEPNEYAAYNMPYEYDVKQIDQTFQDSNEKATFEPIDGVQHANTIEEVPSSDFIANPSTGNKETMSNIEGRPDPRPYTELRATVEKIYTILSVTGIDNDNLVVLPSKLELLSILPHNIDAFDLTKGQLPMTVHDKIASFTIQMQDTTQKLFADIDSSIKSIMQHITLKIKEIETFNAEQICNLKTSLESSAGIGLLDLNHEPIFQKCIQEGKQNNHKDLDESENKLEIKSPLTSSKEIIMVSESIDSDQREPSDQLWVVSDKEFISNEQKHTNENENVQQSDTQYSNLEFGETSVFGSKKSSELNKKSAKMGKKAKENKSQLNESPDTPAQRNHKSKPGNSDKLDMKPKIVKADKDVKSGPKHSELHVAKKREKSGIKKKSKENKYNNASHAKYQKNMNKSSKWVNTDKTSNVSGEWAIKMANGRAEQRHREHQSDWVFERAKSRMSNRKGVKDPYWHNDRDYSRKSNQTVPLKCATSENWKEIKQCMKKTLWKSFIDSAKSVKKAFHKINNKIEGYRKFHQK